MSKLPPIPEPGIKSAHPLANAFAFGYHADQLRSYGQACWNAALEAAAMKADETHPHDWAFISSAIRCMKEPQ